MTVTEFFEKLNSGATWSAGVSFKRANALPLERYSVHASLSDAQTYASTNPVAYPGQIIAVVENDSTGVYYIDHTMNLKEVGKLPTGDNKTITISDDGKLSYKEVTKQTIGELTPQKTIEVKLEIMGDLPEYAISFKDPLGHPVKMFLSISGKDGTLLLTQE